MQNKQNYPVSILVAKYTNTPNADKKNVDLPLGREQNKGEELLAHLYNDVAGDQKNAEVWSYIQQYDQDFNEDALTKDEYDFLKHNFAETVEYVINDSGCMNLYEVGTLPDSTLKFAIDFLELKGGERVYVPNAGYGDVVMLLRNQKVSGYINGSHAWAFAMIRFFAAGIEADIECLNISPDNPNQSPKFPKSGTIDVVLTVYNCAFIAQEERYSLKYDEVWDCLSEKGKALLFTDAACLSGNTDDRIIKDAHSIMQFPEFVTKIGYEVYAGLCAIYVQKDDIRNIVRLIDLSSVSYKTEEKHDFDIDKDRALEIVANNSDHIMYINKKNLDASIYVPTYYFVNRPKIGVSISSVMSIVDTTVADVDDNLPVITCDSLSDDFMHSAIDVESLPNVKKVKYPFFRDKYYVVTEPCILLSVNPMAIQCGYLRDVPANGIAVSSGIIMLKPSTGLSLERATLLLQIENVKEQLKTLSWGLHGEKAHVYFDKVKVHRFAPYVTYDDYYGDIQFYDYPCDSFQANDYPEAHCDDSYHCEVLSDVTPEQLVNALIFESDEEREAFLKSFYVQENDIQEKLVNGIEKQREEIRAQRDYYKKMVRMKKHALSQDISSLSAMFAALDSYRNKHQGIMNNDDMISRVQNTTVKDAFEFIAASIADIEDKVNKIADDSLSWEDDSVIDPVSFMDDYIKSRSKSWLNFHVSKSWGEGGGYNSNIAKSDIKGIIGDTICKGTPLHGIIFPKDALLHVLDNIVANAKEHAFNDSQRKDYDLHFSWHYDAKSITIEVSNNGTPIPDDVNKTMLKTYGYSTQLNKNGHNGIGCYEIDNIMRDYGSFNIVSDKNDAYPVKYVLTFNRVRQ